jgi:hypothetical protein
MTEYRKAPTIKEMHDLLRRGRVELPPLSLRLIEAEPQAGATRRSDALIEASWRGKKARFLVECKALSTPKAFQAGLNQLKAAPLPRGGLPMLFLPFLGENQLQELEREGISGVDLCGNGVVIAPGSFSVFRTGGKNLFLSSAPIKNIYRKNSAMVGRVFLLRPGYATVQEICAEINRLNLLVNRWDKKPMSLSTVSKALKTLEEDLIISRNETIRLMQPDKLLDTLDRNFSPPSVGGKVRLKVAAEGGALQEMLADLSQQLNLPVVATGLSSVSQYATMQRGGVLSVYCPRLEGILERLGGSQEDRFPNLELLETDDETVYFDARPSGSLLWASPIQTYLELMAGDKRDRETAEQVRALILKRTAQVTQ